MPHAGTLPARQQHRAERRDGERHGHLAVLVLALRGEEAARAGAGGRAEQIRGEPRSGQPDRQPVALLEDGRGEVLQHAERHHREEEEHEAHPHHGHAEEREGAPGRVLRLRHRERRVVQQRPVRQQERESEHAHDRRRHARGAPAPRRGDGDHETGDAAQPRLPDSPCTENACPRRDVETRRLRSVKSAG